MNTWIGENCDFIQQKTAFANFSGLSRKPIIPHIQRATTKIFSTASWTVLYHLKEEDKTNKIRPSTHK